ncbi:MAG: hypothetical protein A2275_14150 [Bacteroidetes bacterium RIFOXYA12_FULL_35_11]|nr:MAG: hypothetical protein A2X01_15905 [Bacteroidetes bacterium GWF2_35_48]OFY83508.1 MAG: hypothetical protein A2275_14150 [Bacteroidetes bacterium RIFOXYA12_FULL_35_11]OFZ02362.1 MAG: hypothetical protein A2491_11190 [Bacteroidetes bacterium RIFOXYC12_FULL_35_7]HBX50813.1 hypothetical protein [Bacteroidales bacterium]
MPYKKRNKIKYLVWLCFIIIQSSHLVFSQGTAINNTGAAADNSAILDISATGQGFLLPRMTTTERDNIASPAEALMIFNLTTQCFEAFNTSLTQWISVWCPACQLPGSFSALAASNIVSTGFSANWSASAGATAYYLDVSTNSSFSSFVSGYQNLPVGNVTTYNVTGLTCGGVAYYYRIRANNTCGTSINSNTITLNTTNCCTPSSGCGGFTTMTDARDAQVYNIKQIGTQCWMAQNLNHGTYVTGATGQGAVGFQKFCYGDNSANCTTYGGLYEWAEMMNGASACNGDATCTPCTPPVQGICPAGWHVPSHYEWTLLEKNVGSNPGAFPYDNTTTGLLGTNEGGNLKSTGTTQWTTPNTGATNSSGFTARPGGYYNYTPSQFINTDAVFWSSSEESAPNVWVRNLTYNSAQINRFKPSKVSYAMNLRCVKD